MKRKNTIPDKKSERILTFKNKFTGELVYSSSLYNSKVIDGAEFIQVFPKPVTPDARRLNWMKRDNLELVPSV
jgi:hypothetical protein